MNCILCNSPHLTLIQVLEKKQARNYFRCKACYIIFLDPALRLSSGDEKKRYEKHQNNVTDLGYQSFVKPLADTVIQRVDQMGSLGLDYGSGKDSAISYLLQQQNFRIEKYDPYFNPQVEKLRPRIYDYIVACEVIEHFYNPAAELEKIKSLLKPGGKLFIMTSLWSEDIRFETWPYRRDSTHVCFFSASSFTWIAKKLNFEKLEIITKSMIILS